MNVPVLSRVYNEGALTRIQGKISDDDHRIIFRTYWVRGSQDRLIARFCCLLADILRRAGFEHKDVGDMEAMGLLDSLKLTATYENTEYTSTYNNEEHKPHTTTTNGH